MQERISFPPEPSRPNEFTLTNPAPATPSFHLVSYLIGLLTALILVGGSDLLLRRADPAPIALHPPPTPAPTATPLPTATAAPLIVFVSGAVQKPGTYALNGAARVGDAIAAAGGMTLYADPVLVNQAERIWDGAQIHVPQQETSAPTAPVAAPPAGLSGTASAPAVVPSTGANGGALINLNQASAAQLETLPGIGASKAAAIIANRPYATVDELDRVPGIGAKTLEQLRPYVTAP